MVWAKVTDGREMRKLELKQEMSFEQLKEKVAKLFPYLAGGDFGLQYRDSDGDMISLSTDEEVRTALGQPSGDTLYMVLVPKRRAVSRRAQAPTRESEAVVPFGGNILGRFFDEMEPFWTPSTSSMWDWGDPIWRRREEQVEQQMADLRRTQEEQMKLFEEQRKKAEADLQKTLKERKGGKGGEIQKKGEPTWHVQTFGSWDPQASEGPYGRRTVIGPVGYHMYWGYSDPEEPMQQGEAEQQQSGDQPPGQNTQKGKRKEQSAK